MKRMYHQQVINFEQGDRFRKGLRDKLNTHAELRLQNPRMNKFQ
jgi:adenine C2-methylase RlmN of 23S rRNA A2503 and tRNA A37